MMKKLLYSVVFVFFLSALASNVQAQFITTYAGTGVSGYSGDGLAATNAQMRTPFGIAIDGSGNVYFADSSSHCIRKINASTGVITTIAGTGTLGYNGDGIQATAARLNGPVGVALDAAGNIFISDCVNSRVRKVTVATGLISTVAGNGTAGYVADGVAATTTRINKPYAVAFDATGNFYIADQANSRIRKVITATNIISTFAGSALAGFAGDAAAATTARLQNPEGIAFDAAGKLYIADYGNNRIRVVNTSGIINTVAGNGTAVYTVDNVAATSTGIHRPIGIAFDASGNYYITDSIHHSVRMVNIGTNQISTLAGTNVGGYNNDCITPDLAQLNAPSGLAFDGSGNLYITDHNNSRIRKIVPPCAGTPSPGVAVSTATSGCNPYTPTLSLLGATQACDIVYQWESSPDGSTFTAISGATSATYSPTVTTGTYFDCIVTCNSSGLPATSTSIFLDATDTIVLTPITGPDSLCPATSITLTETTAGGTWSATNGNATVGSLTGVVTGFTAGIDTIIYSATNICGTVRDSAIITVNPIVTPMVSISLSTGSTFVCFGTSVVYTGNSLNGGALPVYTWYVNGIFSGVGNSMTYTPINGDVITCTLTSNAPCPTSLTATTSVTMTVIALVTPTISISDGAYGDTVCLGTIVPFTSSVTNGGLTPVYDWYVNGALFGSGSTFSYAPGNGDVVVCALTSSATCPSPTTVFDTITMTADVAQTPTIGITAFPGDTSCPGYAVTYTAHTLYGGLTPAYLWRKNGIPVATGTTYVYTPLTGDSIQCTLYSSSTCRTDDSVFSNVIHMVITTTSLASISMAAHPGTTIISGMADTFIVTGVNIGVAPTYQWYINGVAVPGANSATFITTTLADNDTVFCYVHNGNPCSLPTAFYSTKLGIHVLSTGIEAISGVNTGISLVPNPNTGNFTIEGSVSSDEQNATVQVTNLLGRVVGVYSAPIVNGQIKKQISINSEIANGIYILHVITNTDRKVARFTLSR